MKNQSAKTLMQNFWGKTGFLLLYNTLPST